MSAIAIEAHSLQARYDDRLVLRGVRVSIAAGRWTSIVGPNGAGKSTLLKVLAGLMPHQGTVSFPCVQRECVSARQKAKHLAWLGQHEKGAEDLTVYDLALLGRLPHRAWLAPFTEADHAAVKQALDMVDAWQWRHRAVGQLSGGERQRVFLARALAVQADVLLMDEPLVNLDPPHQVDWIHWVRALVKQGKTVISVLHEISLALLADEMVVMNDGQVVHHGACAHEETHRAVEGVFDQRIHIQPVDGMWCVVLRFRLDLSR